MKSSWLVVFVFLCLIAPTHAATTPEEVVGRLNEQFAGIRDVEADISLDTSLQIFGCGGLSRQRGRLYFKAPDKAMVVLEKDRYFIRGNSIRKIDKEGKRCYIRLVHAPDFSGGFNPKIITRNFHLKLIKESSSEIVMEGVPKPGVLQNVKKVHFQIDPRENLLRGMDIFMRQNIKGKASINYENIGGLAVPAATYGRSALEVGSGTLVGLIFNLKGEKISVNSGLPEKLFNPGF